MKKTLLSVFVAFILIISFGGQNSAFSQNLAMQIFPLKTPALEKIYALEKFCPQGQLIEQYDANEKLAMVIEYSPEGTLKIYFPDHGSSKKKILNYGQPAITLYKKDGAWYAGNTPADNNSYNNEETERQKKIIDKALSFFKK